jgi:hypothetical protein
MMKNLKLLLAAALTFGVFALSAQDNTSIGTSKVSVTDVYINFGSFGEKVAYGSLDDFRKLAPQSDMLARDLSSYDQQASGSYFNGGTLFVASLGLKFKKKDGNDYRANPQLRIGISYFSSTPLTAGLTRTESFVVDTLVSTVTGEVVLQDSVVNESYNMSYIADQLRLDAALIFRTNPEARWSLYGGIGLAAGVSINPRTEVFYSNWNFDEEFNSGYGNYESERFNNQTSFGLLAYLPLGLDFRLGKNQEFWKRLHLFYEISPGLNMTFIPELNTATNIAIRNGLGLRVSWG